MRKKARTVPESIDNQECMFDNDNYVTEGCMNVCRKPLNRNESTDFRSGFSDKFSYTVLKNACGLNDTIFINKKNGADI